MIGVIFEVWPKPGHREDYLQLAQQLKPKLQALEGFISVERFESLSEPGKILSLSFFENEEAIKQWRDFEQHREAQNLGREYYFSDYRIRVLTVLRDHALHAPPA